MLEKILVLLIVAGAFLLAFRNLYRTLKGTKPPSCGCLTCEQSNLCQQGQEYKGKKGGNQIKLDPAP